jgi:hypothetical protein
MGSLEAQLLKMRRVFRSVQLAKNIFETTEV